MMSKQIVKAKDRRKDYEKKRNIIRNSGTVKMMGSNFHRGVTSGDGIIPKSIKYGKSKNTPTE